MLLEHHTLYIKITHIVEVQLNKLPQIAQLPEPTDEEIHFYQHFRSPSGPSLVIHPCKKPSLYFKHH